MQDKSPEPQRGGKSWRLLTLLGIGIAVACGVAQRDIAARAQSAAFEARVAAASPGLRQLPGWSEDAVAAAVPAFLKSCTRFAQHPD